MTEMIARQSCPFCEVEGGSLLYRIAYEAPEMRRYLDEFYAAGSGVDHNSLLGYSYEVIECPCCGGIYQGQVPSDAMMLELYDHWIDSGAPLKRRATNTIAYYAEHMSEILRLLTLIGKPPGQVRVLDFGGGWSEWALAARGLGCDVAICELSPNRIAYAKANGIRVVDYAAIVGAQFDLINTEQVLEHVPDPLQIMRHLLAGLDDAGLLKVSVPDCSNFKKRLARADWSAPKGTPNSLNALAPLEHLNLFRSRTLRLMAQRLNCSAGKMPILLQLRNTTHWYGGSRILRSIAMPFYRNLANRKNYFLIARH